VNLDLNVVLLIYVLDKDNDVVRIMSKASHRNTGKRRVNQINEVNEVSKLKSESYEMRRLYVQKKDEH